MTDDESSASIRPSARESDDVRPRAATGSSEVELTLPDYDGSEVSIAFDPDYLVEFLRSVEGETTITLEMSGPDKPALFKCGENYLYLVMPLAG